MPAPNIATLYDFESAYEDVLRNYYANTNIGGQTFTQVVTPRTNLNVAEFLVTPRLQVRVSQVGVGQAGSGLQENDQPTGPDYWSYYQLQAELTVVTQRNNSSQNHGLLRGGVRQGMLQASAIMNNNSLPYYQTADVFPLTSVQGIDPQNDEIMSTLTYQLDVFIPPSSFPNT